MVLVLACYGGTGLQMLCEDSVHVIGWCGSVMNRHAVEYATGFVEKIKPIFGDIFDKDCGEGVDFDYDLMVDLVLAADRAACPVAGPEAPTFF
eukprot:3583191-Amphidinium_carterae.1